MLLILETKKTKQKTKRFYHLGSNYKKKKRSIRLHFSMQTTILYNGTMDKNVKLRQVFTKMTKLTHINMINHENIEDPNTTNDHTKHD